MWQTTVRYYYAALVAVLCLGAALLVVALWHASVLVAECHDKQCSSGEPELVRARGNHDVCVCLDLAR